MQALLSAKPAGAPHVRSSTMSAIIMLGFRA